MRRKTSLKTELQRPVLIALLVIIGFMSLTIRENARSETENARVYFETTVRQMTRIIENSVSNTAFFAYTLSRNNAVQAVFTSPDLKNIPYETRRQIDEYMSQNGPFLYLNTGLINVVFLDAEYQPFFATYYSGNDSGVYDYLHFNHAIRSVAQQGGVCQINRTPRTKNGPTFLYAIDVYDARLDKDGNRRMGTIVMLCSLEKYRRDFAAMAGPDALPIQYEVKDGVRGILSSAPEAVTPRFTVDLPVGNTAWRFIAGIGPASFNFVALFSGSRFALFTVVLALLVVPLFLILFHRFLTRPIEKLIREISRLTPSRRLKGSRYSEIDNLSSYINTMLDQNSSTTQALQDKQSELHEIEIVRARAELNALQSQINPHFLYNTLDCVRSIALYHGIDAISDIVEAMSDMFRYTIKGPEIVRIRDEISVIRKYLNIVAVRFSGRYTSRLEIQEGILDLPILKMLLQPLVENALFHGLEHKRSGEVSITGRQTGEALYFTVEDDGKGFDPETLQGILQALENKETPTRQEGVGLLNIHRKIRLFYGAQYGLSIKSGEGRTIVTVHLPKLQEDGGGQDAADPAFLQ